MSDLSIIVVNTNTRDVTCQCLESVYANPPRCDFEIILVDNASTDKSCEEIETRYPKVRLIRNDRNVGFSAANNQAFEIARGKHILLLNNDTVVLPTSLDQLLCALERDSTVGVVAPKLVYPDGSLQMSYGPMPSLMVCFCSFFEVKRWVPKWLVKRIGKSAGSKLFGKDVASYVEWASPKAPATEKLDRHILVTGACMLIRGDCFKQVGPMDPGFFMYVDDADYCARVYDAGWEIKYLSEATVIHIKGGTVGTRYRWTAPAAYHSVFYFLEKHKGRWTARVAKGMALSSLASRFAAKTITAPREARDIWKLLREVAAGPTKSLGANPPGGRRLERDSEHATN